TQAVDAVLRLLHDDRVLHPVLRVQPEGGRYLATAREHDQQAVGDVALGKAEILRLCPIHVDVEAGIARRLLNARIGDAGYQTNTAQQRGRVTEVCGQIRSAHLQIDWGRRAEIQDLADDVGRQER